MHALIAGRRVSYDFTPGPVGAPVVVFVHGLAASKEVWAATDRAIRARFGVLRYDLRGHGDSDAVDAPCSRADLARDLISLMDRLEIRRAVLVGHSAGGVVTMQATVDFPVRVSGLVLVGTASACNDSTAEWYAATAERARREGWEAAMKAMGVRADFAPAPEGRTFAHVALAMRSLNEDPLTERLRTVQVPCLVIVGEKDFLGVGGSVILSRAIAGAELDIRAGRGHGVYLEEPDWFSDRLVGFVTSRVAAPSGCGS